MTGKAKRIANREFQRQHKERMYNAGFKQRVVWVKRDEDESVQDMNLKNFMDVFRKQIKTVPKEKLPRLFKDILSITDYASQQNHS